MTLTELAAHLDERIRAGVAAESALTHGASLTPAQRSELATLRSIRELIR